MAPRFDPLVALPAELVLRILEFVPASGLASLTRASKPWHEFIDTVHQDLIYSAPSKTEHPTSACNFSFLSELKSFAKYFDGVTTFKDLCKRQTLLRRTWASSRPMTRESIYQIGNDSVWRFKPDFKRRFVVSTSQSGGVNVTDMDNGRLLWSLSHDEVRPYAHLEYQDGTAVWDREGNALEVWEADEGARGVFRRMAVLHHGCETRGFQLSYNTLCVVSSEGYGFVYDMARDPPQLKKRLDIEHGAIGHLDQNEHVVLYSMGTAGYHVHSKDTGALLGVLDPKHCTELFHIEHPFEHTGSLVPGSHGRTATLFPPQHPHAHRFESLHLETGPHPGEEHVGVRPVLEDDEWGAGMLYGNIMVGVSRSNRMMVCSDWRRALQSPPSLAATSALLECAYDGGSTFDLGGWLSVKDGRVLFEVADMVYVVTLDDDGDIPLKVDAPGKTQRPMYAASTSSAPQFGTPVSFMALYDDCIMATYATIGWDRADDRYRDFDNIVYRPSTEPRPRLFAIKAIRVLSFAPDPSRY